MDPVKTTQPTCAEDNVLPAVIEGAQGEDTNCL